MNNLIEQFEITNLAQSNTTKSKMERPASSTYHSNYQKFLNSNYQSINHNVSQNNYHSNHQKSQSIQKSGNQLKNSYSTHQKSTSSIQNNNRRGSCSAYQNYSQQSLNKSYKSNQNQTINSKGGGLKKNFSFLASGTLTS
mmetsp:Transcript_14796/g.14387  ORF Transcript_14796/g.14387 Transcript_14796/m.14387 type:complete len:140 (+) Transcript_14796:989-1408(+)